VSGPEHPRDAIDFIAPPVNAGLVFVERRILVEDLVNGGSPTSSIVFSKNVVQSSD
jgi:hypothetical protein